MFREISIFFFWKTKKSPKVPRKTAPAKAESARVYDIIHEEIENRKENTITLNGAAMIREKLNISDRGKISRKK